MYSLLIQIVRFEDDHQPGWVAGEFVDAQGKVHTLIDKVPVLSDEDLNAASLYPRPGAVRIEVLSRSQDTHGRDVVCVTTSIPDGVESTEKVSEFCVFPAQLSPNR
jgi:hypothetical protein